MNGTFRKSKSWTMKAIGCAIVGASMLLVTGIAEAQSTQRTARNSVTDFSEAVEEMVHRVAPAVVQVLASTYVDAPESDATTVSTGIQQRVASGVVMSQDGYIMTNAHVVANAYAVKVRVLPLAATEGIGNVLAQSFSPTVDAALVGTYADADLALLKISKQSLTTLPFASFDHVRQGQVAFAFGSPNGLQNSVSMGVISSIARQIDPDNPQLYLQTDAPINPGNSGGPLVNSAGELVGIDTFISSRGGGSEGVGFAVPIMAVKWVYEQLRRTGYVVRPVIGAQFQTITPALAGALGLPRESGVIVSDVRTGSPAASGGVKLNDILLSIDGHPMDNVAAWTGVSFEHAAAAPMALEVLRDGNAVRLTVTPEDVPQPSQRLVDAREVAQSQIPELGVMAVTLDDSTADFVGPTRLVSGVAIVARLPAQNGMPTELRPRDVIRAINQRPVYRIEDLRDGLRGLTAGAAVALLVEREGVWFYVAFYLP
jgi:serine protease Do